MEVFLITRENSILFQKAVNRKNNLSRVTSREKVIRSKITRLGMFPPGRTNGTVGMSNP